MSITKRQRVHKRQLGQFLTPPHISEKMVGVLDLSRETTILEPSMGDGSFIIPLIDAFLPLYTGSLADRLTNILSRNIWGVELDQVLYSRCLERIEKKWGSLPKNHNFVRADFFKTHFLDSKNGSMRFDIIIGNPPFGGTFDPTLEDLLDAQYGIRGDQKIKKETYAFFIVKSTDLLRKGGRLNFICSDTFLTINTMRGLRSYLMNTGALIIERLNAFSEETSHPMVILTYTHGEPEDAILAEGTRLPKTLIKKTANLSFGIRPKWESYFDGPRLGDFFVATSGMTTGKNEFFVRDIENGSLQELYKFLFAQEPISLEKELKKARLGRLSTNQQQAIRELERLGATKRTVKVVPRTKPTIVPLPHKDYRFYNKGVNTIIYSAPQYVIFWRNNGDAVITYKKSGNWYLRGVGGQPYFLREGLTWQLIASRIHARYLPEGYILDSGAPCAFHREGVSRDEIFFAIGWTLTTVCTQLLKEVINHTKNIQGKDFERLPYPHWVSPQNKKKVIEFVKELTARAEQGQTFSYKSPELLKLEELFAFHHSHVSSPMAKQKTAVLTLF